MKIKKFFKVEISRLMYVKHDNVGLVLGGLHEVEKNAVC